MPKNYFHNIKWALSLFLLLFFAAPALIAQDKDPSKYEEDIKSRKKERLKRQRKNPRKIRSNRRQRRILKYKTRSNQGDKAYKGDITGRRIKPNRSSRRSTANYAKPNPYAGRKRTSEASRAKADSKRYFPPVSASKSGEKAFNRTITGRRIKPNQPSAKKSRYERPDPYRFRKRKTESDIAKQAAKRRVMPLSGTPRSKRAPNPRINPYQGKKRLSENDMAKRAAKRKTAPVTVTQRNPGTIKRPLDPYMGKKRKSETDRGREAARNTQTPISGTRKGEQAKRKTVRGEKPGGRSITGSFKRNNSKRVSPYRGRRTQTNAQKARRNSRKFSPPGSATRSSERSARRTSVNPRSSSGFNRSPSRTVSPYMGRKRITENDKAKLASKNKTRPQTATRPTERNQRRISPNNRSISAFGRTPKKAFSPYMGKEKSTPQQRARRNSRLFSPPVSVTGKTEKPASKQRVTPKTATGQVRIRRRKNPYSGRKIKKWEEAHEGDITGRKLRTKVSTLPEPRRPKFNPYYQRGKMGDKPYSGPLSKQGSRKATRPTENVYKGKAFSGGRKSISSSSEKRPGAPLQGDRTLSISSQFRGPSRRAFDPYYLRGKRGDKPYSGQVIGRGSNSMTRSSEKNPGKPIQGNRNMSITRNSERGQKRNPFVGGKSLSVTGEFRGPGKVLPTNRRGSVTTKWNNKGAPLQGNRNLSITRNSERGQKRNPFVGGKNLSVTGDFRGPGKVLPTNRRGSVTTKWNNDGEPLQGNRNLSITRNSERGQKRNPFAGGKSLSVTGDFRGPGKTLPSNNQGSVTTRWNNNGEPLAARNIPKSSGNVASFQGNRKASRPVENPALSITTQWNNDGEAIDTKAISPQIYFATRFKGRFKERELKPFVDLYYMNYKGNLKVSKTRGKNFHPSFYLAKEKRKPVNQESKFSVKKIWVSIFKSNQPLHLRKKPQKLRFDPGEQGMWYE